MARQALQASLAGTKQAKAALSGRGWTQEYLANQAQCSRQTVVRFFRPSPIERTLFIEICSLLDLDWEVISDLKLKHKDENEEFDIDTLVEQFRKTGNAYIQERCGTMRVLDMAWPVELDEIYTSVNILEKITGRRRLAISELLQENNPEDFDRFGLNKVTEKRLPASDAVKIYSKLMVFGKPGAGKSTFLKHLALQCNKGQFESYRVPIFVTLKDFSETPGSQNLLEYIAQNFLAYGDQKASQSTEKLLLHGRALILFDGLDEVRDENSHRLLNQIRSFVDRFHSNHFVITCRLAAREYTFENFAEVEIADFDDYQITMFAKKWFLIKEPGKAEKFLQKLEESQPIKELATNPLLLTLLCLVFTESADFPSNRSELYKEGLDVLLKKWDTKRNIERDQVYKKLSLQRKTDLLSQIALNTFEQGEYFFKQKALEQCITDYIRNLPDAETDPEVLQLDSEAVLKSIEAQHGLLVERARGIYSFSHLTFQEYLAARQIVASSNPNELDKALRKLCSRIAEKRWYEIFQLSAGMLQNADYLFQLMKREIDLMIASDEKLQQYLSWVNQKSCNVETSYGLTAVRAFYFALGLALMFACDLNYALVHEGNHISAQAIARTRNLTLSLAHTLDDVLVRDLSLDYKIDPELEKSLQSLREQLPESNQKKFEEWWKGNGKNWTHQLRELMIKHRNIGHNWQFNRQQIRNLEQYYDANKLLINCINSDCYVTRLVRREIEETLLLPISEIEKR